MLKIYKFNLNIKINLYIKKLSFIYIYINK